MAMVEPLIGAFSKIFVKILEKLPFQRKNAPPKRTLRLVLQPRGAWWHMGSVGQKPAMQVVCEWHATNLTDGPIVITTAFIKKPRTEATHPLVRHPYKNVFGSYRVQAKDTTKLILDFWVEPPVRKEGEAFKATVIVKDQFDNEHRIKDVEFKYR